MQFCGLFTICSSASDILYILKVLCSTMLNPFIPIPEFFSHVLDIIIFNIFGMMLVDCKLIKFMMRINTHCILASRDEGLVQVVSYTANSIKVVLPKA